MADDKPKVDASDDKALAGVESRLGELSDLFQKWESARVGAFKTRIGVVGVILVMIAVYLLFLYNIFAQVKTPKFAREATRAALSVATRVMSKAHKPAMKAGTELLEDFRKQASVDFAAHKEEINAKLQEEIRILKTDLNSMVKRKMQERVDRAAEAQRKFLVNSFPELLKDDAALDRTVAKLKPALDGAVVTVMQARIDKARKKLETVTRQALDFLPEDKRAGFYSKMSEIWERLGDIQTKREAAAKSGS